MPNEKPDRRTILKGLAAATTAPFWPGCAVEPGPTPATPDPATVQEAITHTVVLMMENRTFDHYFGSLSLVEGRSDVDGLVEGMSNPDLDGVEIPVHLGDQSCVPDPPHGWGATHRQWNEGAMDGFVREYIDRWGAESAHLPMQYWTRDELSALYGLSDRYSLCQRWHCSVLSSTWPNRFYSHAASNNGATGNDFGHDYDMPTVYQRLEEKGVSWGCYHLTAPFMLLLPGHWSEENFWSMETFYYHARAGSLPQVTILEPFYGRADDHPPAHPLAGELLIASIYKALAESPLWGKLQLFITYDEHGGFYDHVAPPVVPDPFEDQGFGQAGFRVPGLAVGPYVKQEVNSTVFDHTSMIAWMNTLYGLDPLNVRDEAANNFFDTLDLDRLGALNPAAPIELPVIEADVAEIYAEECIWDLGRDGGEGLMCQPEFETFLDSLPMQHVTDNRETYAADFADFLDLTESMGVWRRG